jgi:integrase
VVWTASRITEWQLTRLRPAVAVWTAAQTAQFLHSIREHRLYAAFHLIALRGLRRGETVGLRWCDLDLDAGLLMVCQQLQHHDGALVICPPKSAASRRAVALDHTTVAALRRHHAHQLAQQQATPGYRDSGYVFTKLDGDPLTGDLLTRTFVKLSADAGLPPIRLHDLRHGAASLSLAAGTDLKIVQDMLGHASIVLTADTYTSVLPDTAHQAAEATARLVLDAANTTSHRIRAQRRRRHRSHRRGHTAAA